MGWFEKREKEAESVEPEKYAESGESAGTVEYDRKHCIKYLEGILSEEGRHARGVAMKLYIENFKRLNEVFGYDYGEELLEQIMSWLRETTGAAVYRYVGVEFVIVLEQYTVGQATELCDRIAERFGQVWKIAGTDCLCSAQMGLCSYPGHASKAGELLQCLDAAVSRASEYGPNQVITYDSTLQAQLARKQTIARHLKSSIEKHEVEVRFRPTYQIEEQRFVRAELYMRIFVEGLGMIGSTEFLPVAEDSGQIWTLECFALDRVGACIAELLETGKEFESISTRISPIVFLQEDFLDEVQQVIDRYRIPRGKMALEITESVFTTAYLNINVMLQQLSEMGVEIILNDFGSGYSGISSILDLPVDTVKFERMFIWKLEGDSRAAILVDGLVKTAKGLGLKVIAEGVETTKQLDALNGAGCLYQQGFYYSPTIGEDVLQDIMDTSLDASASVLEAEKEKMR